MEEDDVVRSEVEEEEVSQVKTRCGPCTKAGHQEKTTFTSRRPKFMETTLTSLRCHSTRTLQWLRSLNIAEILSSASLVAKTVLEVQEAP
jgi:hypothetical protein